MDTIGKPEQFTGDGRAEQKKMRYVFRIAILLTGLYFLCSLVANVTAVKMIEVFGLVMPAGTLVFAITFTLRDSIQRVLGKRISQAVILIGALLNLLMVLYFQLTIQLQPAVFWPHQDAYALILGAIPRIVLASIVAMIISELVDTEVYSIWVQRVDPDRKYLWSRVIASNAIAVPIDSIVFQLIAFAGIFPLSAMFAAMVGQTIFKYMVTVVSVPLIYITPNIKRPITGEEV